jgi:hypothetical protein
VGQDAFVGDFIDTLKLREQFFERAGLGRGDRLVVEADDFDADRVTIQVGSAVPHAAARMEGDAVFIDDPIDMPVGIDHVMRFASGLEFPIALLPLDDSVVCSTM